MAAAHRIIRRALVVEEWELLATACRDAAYDGLEHGQQGSLVDITSRVIGHYAPRLTDLISTISVMRSDEIGLLILEGLPAVDDPLRLIAIVGSMLGKLTAYESEGDYVIAIKERKTVPGERPSFKNSREFYLHTDLSYSSAPPLFFLLHSIVNNSGEGGLSTFCDIEAAVDQLDGQTLDELQKPQFLFPAPPHYRGIALVQYPVLERTSPSNGWRVRFRRDNLRSLTRSGMEAIIRLISAFDRTTVETSLDTGSMALVNNRTFLHGRTAFVASDRVLKPRHLNRTYVDLA